MIRRLLYVVMVLALAGSVSGCGLVRSSIASLKSTADFVPMAADARALAEPGSEDVAVIAAKELSGAIATVEREQYRPFAGPVRVYVTRDEESFAAFTGVAKEVRGAVILKLFLSGGLRKEPDRIKRILAHELSHLHLGQRLGIYGYNASLPSWFQEGLAVIVSSGGGAEKMSEAGAAKAILQGKSLIPEDTGSFFFKKFAASYGLKPPMFYRQSGMFVSYLRRHDEAGFRTLLLAVEEGRGLRESFKNAYGMGIEEAWQQFIKQLKQGGAAS
ncbi:peptidase MA family metallohydrolase [Geotalea toluenoxydans]